jgi:hypothetical protein
MPVTLAWDRRVGLLIVEGKRTRTFSWRSSWSMRSVMMPWVEIEPSWRIAIVSAKSCGE